ncbi:PAN domain protein [hydrothermal vent metagenome]|uniref:PAN domain protein n=1 Tax=hydrothermal vent metagenome TaxID=652676 RepID=A0A1W1C8K7_9ZZZZ
MKNTLWLLLFLLPILLFSKTTNTSPNAIHSIESRETKNKVGLCAVLKDYFYIEETSEIKFEHYIKIIPKHHFTVDYHYKRLCVNGLKPNTKYQVSFHKNLPLSQKNLDKNYLFEKKTGNYEPSISFPEKGYILPTKGEISIPIQSMNVHTLSLSLYKINDRNLIEQINDYGLLRSIDKYDYQDIENETGVHLWTKKISLYDNTFNVKKLTAIPMEEYLGKREAGVYILHANMLNKKGEELYRYNQAMQWFMISDIGIYTLKSDKGLHVFTKSLSSAKAYNKVKLELISKSNEILDTQTSKDGEAFFPATFLNGKKGLQAKAIYAYGENNDFSILDLSKPAHDLSDRGVKGRETRGENDAFIYSNRDIFRPSERMTFHALIRGELGNAKADLAVSAKIFDARGEEVYTKLLHSDNAGHISGFIDIPSSAVMGKWRIALYTGKEKAIGSYSFLVEDFVPPKIKTIILDESPQNIAIQSKYLNDEVFPHASVEVNTVIHKAKNFSSEYKDYSFGDIEASFRNKSLDILSYETDAEGKVNIPFEIKKTYNTSFPLSAFIDIVVSELGGRPVHKYIEKVFDNRDNYIGIKALFDNDAVDMEAKPSFKVVYFDKRKLSKKSLFYEIIEEERSWQWRWADSSEGWEYYKTYSDHAVITSGTLESLDSEPSLLTLDSLDWGSYRLKIYDDKNTLSTYRFSSGYEESDSKSSPDRLPFAINKQSYTVGNTLRVNIKSKFTGPILFSIANNNIIESKTVHAIAGKSLEVSFEVKDSWGSSAYVLATAFRAESQKLGANRAIGLVPLQIVHPEKIIDLSLSHIAKTSSNSQLSIQVKAKKMTSSPTYITLALVDEGVLNLTDYTLPNPMEYFFGQQKLGIEIRDIYAYLIEAKGTHAKFNVGAGDDLPSTKEKAVTNKRKVVALFSKVLQFEENSTNTTLDINMSIPDYQGALKVMAIAWSQDALGNAQSRVIVQDPISIEYYMPSFLAVGDIAQTRLSIHIDKAVAEGTYQVNLRTKGGILLSPHSFEIEVDEKHRHFSKDIKMSGESVEEGSISIEVSQHSKILQAKTFEIALRTAYPSTYVREIKRLEKDAKLDPSSMKYLLFWENIHKASLSISNKILLPKKSLKEELIDYKGRCAEQTTSRAMPWLFAKKRDNTQDEIIKSAITRLLTYQNISGGFGLWQGYRVDLWLSAYVLDFLTRAKKAGYAIPEYNLKKGLDYLENNLDKWSKRRIVQEANIYALYVLTRAGRVFVSELKHYNTNTTKLSSLALGHLAGAFATIDENTLAKKLFHKAKKSLNNKSYYGNYGGKLRNYASLIALIEESKLDKNWKSLFADLALSLSKIQYFSTQELSTLLRVAYLMDENTKTPSPLKLLVNGEIQRHTQDYSQASPTLSTLDAVTNKSATAVWYDMSFRGTASPNYYENTDNNGFSLEKNIYTLEGKKVDLENILQNQRLVIVISGKIEHYQIENPLITDYIPSGFELDNPHLSGINFIETLEWIPTPTTLIHESYRIDRYEAVLEANQESNNSFIIAYMVRAVSRGEFTLAPSKIEDMYQGQYRALSPIESKKVKILKKEDIKVQEVKKISILDTLLKEDYAFLNTKYLHDLKKYSILEVNVLRNAIFAQGGLNYENTNPMLHERFSAYAWYTAKSEDSAKVYQSLSKISIANIQSLLKEEKQRGGGLVLADYYRVNTLVMTEALLAKYSKRDLKILRNSLFARYGRKFKEESLTKIFSFMPWYRPSDITVSEIFDELMSEREKNTILLMIKLAKQL